MATTLSQSAAAAFPDRPGASGVGLRVAMTAGDEGALIGHDMGAEQPVLHVRFLCNPWGVAGGRVVLLAGLDGQSAEVMRLSLDAATRELNVRLPGGGLSAVLDGVLPWQCVELGINTASGDARLWVNGVPVDHVGADLSASTIRTVLFGAIHKQTAVAGALYLDELCLADAYVGPCVVAPSSAHADDPARWLVLYNAADPEAVLWAEHYRQARGVPYANLAGLALPTSEVINAGPYVALVGAVDDYLASNSLDAQVMGVLLGYRVPGYVDFTGGGMLEAVPALMQTSSAVPGTIANGNAMTTLSQRLILDDLAGVRMTARIDGPDRAAATQIVDRANLVIANGLAGGDSTIYFDPFVGDEPAYQAAFTSMLGWATGLRGMRTRLPFVLSGDASGNDEVSFDAVSNDGLFVGWSSALPDPGIFVTPAGRRVLCVQLFLEGASATGVRNPVPDNWAETPISAGYAAAIASSRSNPVAAIPDAGALLDALRQRWTLAEAFHVAQPLLRSGFHLIGDPLMTVAMPRNGFEVFGPLDSLEELDPATPAFVLAEGVTRVDLSDNPPAESADAHYVVRRSDALGRIETSCTSLRLTSIEGVAYPSVTLPAWPDATGWPVVVESGMVRLRAVWAEPLADTRIDQIELLAQPDGQGEAVIATPAWTRLDRWVTGSVPIPAIRTRYRWRFTSSDGVVRQTGFSDWVEPAPLPTIALQQIGADV